MRLLNTLAAVVVLSGCASAPCGGRPRVYNHGLLLPGACAPKPDKRALCRAFDLDSALPPKVTAISLRGDLIVYTTPSVTCEERP